MTDSPGHPSDERAVRIALGNVVLDGDLAVPQGAHGIVLFAHGSGSSRFSPRNRAVAAKLQDAGFATLLLDLLTSTEEQVDAATGELRFDIPLLAVRLAAAAAWVAHDPQARGLPLGYFGASTGAAAALLAAAGPGSPVHAVVSRGGRPDLAGTALGDVRAPTLLIVGGRDTRVIALNELALRSLHGVKEMAIVPGAGHLFEEPGALDRVAELARGWFERHLAPAAVRSGAAGGGW